MRPLIAPAPIPVTSIFVLTLVQLATASSDSTHEARRRAISSVCSCATARGGDVSATALPRKAECPLSDAISTVQIQGGGTPVASRWIDAARNASAEVTAIRGRDQTATVEFFQVNFDPDTGRLERMVRTDVTPANSFHVKFLEIAESKLGLLEAISLVECVTGQVVESIHAIVQNSRSFYSVQLKSNAGERGFVVLDPDTCDLVPTLPR